MIIKPKNIYYMLAYAFDAISEKYYSDLGSESFDKALDLFSQILILGIKAQLKKGLYFNYNLDEDSLAYIKGKVDISKTVASNSLIKSKVYCVFDEFSMDNLFNRVIKYTMKLLIKSNDVERTRKIELKKLLEYFVCVKDINAKDIIWSSIQYQRNNVSYKIIINVCYLIIEGMLVNEQQGHTKFLEIEDSQAMSKLYEKFILNYYKIHYPEFNANASYLYWDAEDDLWPALHTDIFLSYKGRYLILDAKYYTNILITHMGKKKLNPDHLNQISSYVIHKDPELTGIVYGMLLYAKTDEPEYHDSESSIGIHNNKILIRTLSLCEDFDVIQNELRCIADILFNMP